MKKQRRNVSEIGTLDPKFRRFFSFLKKVPGVDIRRLSSFLVLSGKLPGHRHVFQFSGSSESSPQEIGRSTNLGTNSRDRENFSFGGQDPFFFFSFGGQAPGGF